MILRPLPAQLFFIPTLDPRQEHFAHLCHSTPDPASGPTEGRGIVKAGRGGLALDSQLPLTSTGRTNSTSPGTFFLSHRQVYETNLVGMNGRGVIGPETLAEPTPTYNRERSAIMLSRDIRFANEFHDNYRLHPPMMNE
ncbi:Hypothetical protein NTJ_01839 [Nesidiocoris tenuis]|uniref:Uncharacterized protein n=1 Tax=Nesidiocoris tenuis TaxID=355587 RepID=A0ABN7AFG1_9HEMI|nr:Hypothetical protein NTJ_01839 [Nesidiocoris tenuis]